MTPCLQNGIQENNRELHTTEERLNQTAGEAPKKASVQVESRFSSLHSSFILQFPSSVLSIMWNSLRTDSCPIST